jgi:hypothetical protein
MNYSALQFMASVVQKYGTLTLKNMPSTAEASETSPDWVASVGKLYYSMMREKRARYALFLLSGDLDACTDKYFAQVSQALSKAVISPHYQDRLLPDDIEQVIATSLGRFDIFEEGGAVKLMRENPDAREATEELYDLEDSNYPRIRQTVGQHMSSSGSFYNMGAMHQAVYDTLLPNVDADLQRLINKSSGVKSRQMLRRMMNNPTNSAYLYGISNIGTPTTRFYVEVQQKGGVEGWINIVTKMRVEKLLAQTLERVRSILYEFPVEIRRQFSIRFYPMIYANLADRLGLPRKERESDGYEFKSIQETHRGQFPPISQNEVISDFYLTDNLKLGFRVPTIVELFQKQAKELYKRISGVGGRPFKNMKELMASDAYAPVIEVLMTKGVSLNKRQNILYTSDSAIRRGTWEAKGIPDGKYELRSMIYSKKITVESQEVVDKAEIKNNQSPFYLWNVGDDHLLFTKHMDYLKEYMTEICDGYNMIYSKKANYIINARYGGGLVIAERLGRIDPRTKRIYPQLYAKLKQIVVERSKMQDSTWMERAPSIKTQLKGEFLKKINVNGEHVWRLIERTQCLLYYHHDSIIKEYAMISIDPRLPTKIGGFDIWKGADFETSELTHMHLRLLKFYRTQLPEFYPRYVKEVRKRLNRFRTERMKMRPKKPIPHGAWPIPKLEYKQLIFKLIGYMNMFEEKSETVEVSWKQVAQDVNTYVTTHYNIWEGDNAFNRTIDFINTGEYLNEKGYLKPKVEKVDVEKLLAKWNIVPLPKKMSCRVYIDECIQHMDEDLRTLNVDYKTFEMFNFLKREQDVIINEVSRIRGELLTTDLREGLQPEVFSLKKQYKSFQEEGRAKCIELLIAQTQVAAALNI